MKRPYLSSIYLLLLVLTGMTQASPTIFGVDPVSQQLVSFDPWTGVEFRRLNLPGGVLSTEHRTGFGLAGSQNHELYYIYSYSDESGILIDSQFYVLDSSDGSVKQQIQHSEEPIDGLGYENGYFFASGCTSTDLHRFNSSFDFWWGGPDIDGIHNAVGGDDYGRIFASTSNEIYEFDPLISGWNRKIDTELTGIMGMAYDGTYLYASTLDNIVYTLNPDTAAVLNSISMDYTLYALGAAPVVIPSPSALVLGSIGVGFITWLRRRRTL